MTTPICAVVGAGPGVGLAVARRFAREGFRPALIARRTEALEGYVNEFRKSGVEAHAFAADAAQFDTLRAVFDEIKRTLGEVDVLVYNAAVVAPGLPSTLDAETLVAHFTVNAAGALVASQQVIPYMRAQRRGSILFTGGGLALSPRAQFASTSISKGGLRSLALTLAQELEPDGIHVAIVTIAGFVQPGTHFDPDKIAETYWTLHTRPAGKWEQEIVYY